MDEAVLKLLFLWGFYLIYMVVGAFIFMELEYENERALVSDFKQTFQELNSTRNLSTAVMNDLSSVYRKAYSMGIDLHSEKTQNKWDFAGSFYFVGTVLTTIGFGLTAPITISGQVFFLIYAILGIPLNILLFNTLLDQTVHLLTYILGRLHRCWRTSRDTLNITPRTDGAAAFWEPSTVVLALVCLLTVTIIIMVTAPLFVYLEKWSFFESVYFAVVAFTTVGFGDFVPSGIHTGSGQNLSPHYKVGNWFIIIVGTIFMYTATALIASVYKQCLEHIIENCQKFRKNKAGRNHAAVSPQAPSTPPVRERAPSLSPLRDERNRVMARLVLKNWRAIKKVNIGQVNAVEASILKSRLTNNEDHVTSTPFVMIDNISTLSSDNNEAMRSKIKEQTSLEELSTIEAKLTNEFNQLIRDIQQHRETLTETNGQTNESVERGIENGIVISISPVTSRTCMPTFSPRGDDDPCVPGEDDCDSDSVTMVTNHSLKP